MHHIDVLKVSLEPSAITAVFGVAPQGVYLSQGAKHMIAFGSLLARRLILHKWKEKFPPTFKLWLRDIILFGT